MLVRSCSAAKFAYVAEVSAEAGVAGLEGDAARSFIHHQGRQQVELVAQVILLL